MWALPADTDLAEPDRRLFDFVADRGWRFIGDGRSLFFASMSITKPGVRFSDQELFLLGNALQNFFDDEDVAPQTNARAPRIFQDGDFPSFTGRYVYKFLTEESYSQYVERGSFLLSSLARYRRLEDQGDPSGDRFEGASLVAYAVDDRELTAATVSGFDTLIFSSACDLENAAEMMAKFGPVVLRIDPRAFAAEIGRAVGAIPETRLVQYADLKIHRSRLAAGAVQGFPPNLTSRLARALRKKSRLPSLFASRAGLKVNGKFAWHFNCQRTSPIFDLSNVVAF